MGLQSLTVRKWLLLVGHRQAGACFLEVTQVRQAHVPQRRSHEKPCSNIFSLLRLRLRLHLVGLIRNSNFAERSITARSMQPSNRCLLHHGCDKEARNRPSQTNSQASGICLNGSHVQSHVVDVPTEHQSKLPHVAPLAHHMVATGYSNHFTRTIEPQACFGICAGKQHVCASCAVTCGRDAVFSMPVSRTRHALPGFVDCGKETYGLAEPISNGPHCTAWTCLLEAASARDEHVFGQRCAFLSLEP